MPHLLLKDRRFQIAAASITAVIGDPYWCDKYNGGAGKELLWGIDIATKERKFDGEYWQPNLGRSLRFNIRRWVELEGQMLSWKTPYDRKTGEVNGTFYVFEHEDIPRGTLTIGRRKGNGFRVAWEGVCNVQWNKEFGKNVPFSLAATATFDRVIVHGSERDDKQAFRERLSQYLDPADFRASPIQHGEHKYQSGVGMASMHFAPKV